MASLCLKWVQYLSYIVDIKLVDGLVLSVLWLSAGMALDKVIMNNFSSLNSKIEIHDSQCNLRCRAINIFKIFCRMKTLRPNNILKMTSSRYSEITLASWRLQPWATRLFVRQIIQTKSKANTKAPRHRVLWEPSITGGFSSQMGRWCGNRHWYYDNYSTHYGAIWRHKYVNTDSGNGLLPDGTKPLTEPVLTYHR